MWIRVISAIRPNSWLKNSQLKIRKEMKFKKGDSVRVKKGTSVDGFEKMDFTGWQGWVVAYFEDGMEDEKELTVEWDSITLENLPKEYIQKNIDEDFDFDSIILAEDTLEKANKRDNVSDRIKVIQKMEEQYDYLFDVAEGFRPEDSFFIELFESNNIDVNPTNLRKYLAYIKENIEMPCILTGIESMGTFGWEERFDFGYGEKEEREELRKTRPSYKDSYELVSFLEKDIADYNAIKIKAKRISDKKTFIIGLDELKPLDKTTENYAILDAYVKWYVNY